MAPAGLAFGRYLLGERLALGGMGEVRLALQLGMGQYEKPIALKLLLPHLATDEAAVEMFLNEARLASRMNHPNVVKIFDVGAEAGQYFIAMELIQGVSMSALIQALTRAGQKLPQPVLAYVGRALCDGLHHAHEMTSSTGERLGIIHRDVTPHNVMLSVHGEVKLTDFGIARAQDTASYTADGSVKGKLPFLAPEQVAGRPFDQAVDIYGLGISLFQLATGISPFSRGNSGATLEAIRTEPLPELSRLRPDLSPDFVAAIERSADKVPAHRFPSALAFKDALRGEVAGPEVLGAFVAKLCEEAVTRLDAQAKTTLTLRGSGTASLGETTAAARGRSRLAVAMVAGALFAAGAAAAITVLPRQAAVAPVPEQVVAAAPAPPVAAARPEPSPAAAPVPAAAPEPEPPRRAAKRPDPAPAKKKVGYLSVDAVPWAIVHLGGKKIGETPIARFPVESGASSLLLVNPETGKRATRKVIVRAGREKRVRVDLR